MTTAKKFDWEIVLSVINPVKEGYGSGRPRRLSLHSIVAMVKRDAATVLKEMKDSGLVVGYVCPDVKTPIFYLLGNAKLPNMIDTRNAAVWEAAAEKIKTHPPEKVKGFKRFAAYHKKADGSLDYAKGMIKDPDYSMDVPFEAEDADYEKAIVEALGAAGF
jgi:hypothetical protein